MCSCGYTPRTGYLSKGRSLDIVPQLCTNGIIMDMQSCCNYCYFIILIIKAQLSGPSHCMHCTVRVGFVRFRHFQTNTTSYAHPMRILLNLHWMCISCIHTRNQHKLVICQRISNDVTCLHTYSPYVKYIPGVPS